MFFSADDVVFKLHDWKLQERRTWSRRETIAQGKTPDLVTIEIERRREGWKPHTTEIMINVANLVDVVRPADLRYDNKTFDQWAQRMANRTQDRTPH